MGKRQERTGKDADRNGKMQYILRKEAGSWGKKQARIRERCRIEQGKTQDRMRKDAG